MEFSTSSLDLAAYLMLEGEVFLRLERHAILAFFLLMGFCFNFNIFNIAPYL